jgi:hypothetical protein
MIGILFARPGSPLADKEIIPNLAYFHHRSRKHFNFWCAGYEENSAAPSAPPWPFSVEKFLAERQWVETRTQWRYSGSTDLILTDACVGETRKIENLSFSTAVLCCLDRMIEDKTIHSVETFFEVICRYAETAGDTNPTAKFSDLQGVKVAGSALKRIVLSLLPKQLGDDAVKASHFAVRDIGI